MIGIIRECQKIVQDLRSTISRTRSERLVREDLKDRVRAAVDGYFRTDRPILLQKFRDEDVFVSIDGHMQDLLRYTQGRTSTAKYLATLRQLQKEWGILEVNSIPKFGDLTGGEVPELTVVESSIIETLNRLCPPASACYRQSIEDLNDESRLSWRGTAAELREALREVLDILAPDEEVEKSPGFKLEKDARGPTMKQKVSFILRSRRESENARKTVEQAVEVVEEKVGSFVRSVYNRSSGSVHVERSRDEIISIKRFVETVLMELLMLNP